MTTVIEISAETRAAQEAHAVGGVFVVLTEDERALVRRYLQRAQTDIDSVLEVTRPGDVHAELVHQAMTLEAVVAKLKEK